MLVVAAAFLAAMGYLVHNAFATGGSVFGNATGASNRVAATAAPPAVSVEGGGPPAAVRTQLADLRERIVKNPKDDVALTQLADMYLAVGKYGDAIPYYKRALAVNPNNVAAKEGLSEAESESKQ
ncbi:MAG TPA: tetratricopeptide repeat protein [Candidatus Baltobacteraceae bacterium]|nr:tetratricopeptide repeat protein [Candidatus Baltobacteraceae bacterium]